MLAPRSDQKSMPTSKGRFCKLYWKTNECSIIFQGYGVEVGIKNPSNNQNKNIIQIVNEPMLSVDYNHNPHSSILDAQETKVISNSFCRILSWYDNEWGFSNRLIDVTKELF